MSVFPFARLASLSQGRRNARRTSRSLDGGQARIPKWPGLSTDEQTANGTEPAVGLCGTFLSFRRPKQLLFLRLGIVFVLVSDRF